MIELLLTQMAHNGYCIGRHRGKVIFVPYALPGETVEVEIPEDRKTWARARLRRVLDPSSRRVKPRCPHFGPGKCGGCQWQHIDYEAQLEFKTLTVKEQLRRLGGFVRPDVKPAVSTGIAWGYRNNIQLHAGEQGWGFVREDSGGVLPVKTCPVAHRLLGELLPAAIPTEHAKKLILRTGVRTGERMMVLETDRALDRKLAAPDSTSLILCHQEKSPRLLKGKEYFFEEVAGKKYRISPRSFFQVNTEGAEELLALVKKYARPEPGSRTADLYSGVGLFTLHFFSMGCSVMSVESDPWAAADLKFNCGDSGEGVRIIEKDVAEVLGSRIKSADIVICDPPRRGCGLDVIKKIVRLSPQRLVYVSCDPATLARDARWLFQSGYALAEIQPVDLFPQTFHIEAVALFLPR